MYVLATDDRGQYEIPFYVVFRDDSWWNARTGEELDVFIAGWRPPSAVSSSPVMIRKANAAASSISRSLSMFVTPAIITRLNSSHGNLRRSWMKSFSSKPFRIGGDNGKRLILLRAAMGEPTILTSKSR